MIERSILLTIKRKFAEEILAGNHPFEYRKSAPRIKEPIRTIMYVSTGIREIIGEFTMGPVSGNRTSLGFPLPVSKPIQYVQPLPWKEVRREIPEISAPTISFRYLNPVNDSDARLLKMLENYR
jgi:predicted transcriptional regulator